MDGMSGREHGASGKKEIVKLNGSNYHAWSIAVIGHLYEKEWEAIMTPIPVSSTMTAGQPAPYTTRLPNTFATVATSEQKGGVESDATGSMPVEQLVASVSELASNPRALTFGQINRRAWGFIISVLDSTHHTLFGKRAEGDGRALWHAIRDHYRESSPLEIMQVRQRLASIKLESHETMDAYIARLTDCFDRLSAQGHEMDEATRFQHIAVGLPSDYQTFVKILRTQQDQLY